MLRDYSEEKLNELQGFCEYSFQRGFWEEAWDALSDIGKWITKLTGIVDIDNYVGNVSEYHKFIVDMKNYTNMELSDIFNAVHETDYEYQKNITPFTQAINELSTALKGMAEAIPSVFFDEMALGKLGKKIEKWETKIDETTLQVEASVDRLIEMKQSRMQEEEVKNIVKATLSISVTALKIVVDAATGNAVAAGSDAWDMLDGAARLGVNIGSLITMTAIPLVWSGCKDKQKYQSSYLETLEDLDEIDDSKTFLKAASVSFKQQGMEEFAEGLDSLDKGANVVRNGYKLYKGATGFVKGFGESRFDLKIELDDGKIKMLEEAKKTQEQIETIKETYSNAKAGSFVLGMVKDVVDYAYAYAEDGERGVLDEIGKGHSKLGGLVDKTGKLNKAVGDFVEKGHEEIWEFQQKMQTAEAVTSGT